MKIVIAITFSALYFLNAYSQFYNFEPAKLDFSNLNILAQLEQQRRLLEQRQREADEFKNKEMIVNCASQVSNLSLIHI